MNRYKLRSGQTVHHVDGAHGVGQVETILDSRRACVAFEGIAEWYDLAELLPIAPLMPVHESHNGRFTVNVLVARPPQRTVVRRAFNMRGPLPPTFPVVAARLLNRQLLAPGDLLACHCPDTRKAYLRQVLHPVTEQRFAVVEPDGTVTECDLARAMSWLMFDGVSRSHGFTTCKPLFDVAIIEAPL